MPTLKSIGRRFESEFLVDGGAMFKGVIDQPNDREPPSLMFTRPRRLLQVRQEALVKIGDVIVSPSGQEFLVGSWSGADAFDQILYRVHRLFEVTDHVVWSRVVTTTDALTGLAKTSGTFTSLGTIKVAIEPLDEDIDRQVHVHQERWRVITSANVLLNDRLNERNVKRVTSQMGLHFAEIQ